MKRSEEESHCLSFIRIILFISCYITNWPVEASNNVGGFSIELIHRDSSLLNPNLSHFKDREIVFDRLGSSSLFHDFGMHLMKIWYGEPPVEFLQLFDTVSNISWIQCLPCIHCYQSRYDPYNPNTSRTFKWKTCGSNRKCPYSVNYLSNSSTNGFLAKETIMVGTIPHRVQIKNFIFGCGHENRGQFPPKSAGILAFDPGEISFITQLSTNHHGKFSFCMTESSSSQPGRVNFGNEAIVSGRGVMTTPLIVDDFYNVLLQKITVGTKDIKNLSNHSENANIGAGNNNNIGHMMVDSGSTIIYLPHKIYSKVEKSVQKQIKKKILVPSPHPALKVCYSKDLKDIEIPKITLHFPGADLELSPLNTFYTTNDFRCLAIHSTESEEPMLGNMAMTNFLIGLDLVEKKISFKRTNCSTL